MAVTLSVEQRRALEMLDKSHGSGCPRLLWVAHGFTLAMLVSLVRDGLADVQAETVSEGGGTIETLRIRITGAGRRAIEGPAEACRSIVTVRSRASPGCAW
jgi:hypothetical protein